VESGAVSESLTVGKNFQLRGSKIKVDGEAGTPGWGGFFVPTDGGAAVQFPAMLLLMTAVAYILKATAALGLERLSQKAEGLFPATPHPPTGERLFIA
jgi:hypothetical protein